MSFHNPQMLPKVRSRRLLDATRHMPCCLRISSFYPGHKCAGADTVVPAHVPTIGKGVSSKVSDLFVVAACFHCHDILDGRDLERRNYLMETYPSAVLQRILDGMAETQARWIGMGLIQIDGMEVV